VVSDVIDTPLSGSTCVLAYSNQEVWEIAGMLSTRKRAVKIIQSNDGFDLFDILEIRYFYDNLGDSAVVLEDVWEDAKRKLNSKFKNTEGLEIAEKVIRKFEQSNQQIKYKSDFEVFALESNLEDFLGEYSTDTIFVSTMHKAKGKEFDNVFIALNQYDANTDEKKRFLYVAMTRAKNLLHIHFHGTNIFGTMPRELEIKFVPNLLEYPSVNRVPMYLTHRDVYLSYGKNKQREIEKLSGNEKLTVGSICDSSRKFKEQNEELKNKGFEIKEVKAHLIVYWKGNEMNEEIKIILPMVLFERDKCSKQCMRL
jgi:ATP-dependent DNA helicase RecQ